MLAALLFVVVFCLPQAPPPESPHLERFADGCHTLERKDFDGATAIFRTCLDLRPENPNCAYYLSCAAAGKGELTNALEWLARAADWGYDDAAVAEWDMDFESLRELDRFREILDGMRAHQASRLATPGPPVVPIEAQSGRWTSWMSVPPSYSQDGERVLAAYGGRACLWDDRSGSLLAIFSQESEGLLDARFSPDGRFIATAARESGIRLWDAFSGEFLRGLPASSSPAKRLSFSADGERLLALLGQEAALWDTNAGKLLRRFPFDSASFALLSPDGRWLMEGEREKEGGAVLFWDARTGRRAQVFHNKDATGALAAFSPDGKLALVGSHDRRLVKVIGVASGEVLSTLRSPGAPFSSGCFLDTDRIATVDSGSTVLTWSWREAECTHRCEGALDMRLAASPDGDLVQSFNKDVAQMWDAASGALLWHLALPGAWYSGACFRPDGQEVAAGSELGRIHLRDAKTGTVRRILEPPAVGAGAATFSPTFSPDGSRLAVPCEDGSIRVLSAESGREELDLRGHEKIVGWAGFSPDGELIASDGLDYRVRTWNATTGAPLAVFDGRGAIQFDASGARILFLRPDSHAAVGDPRTGRLLAEFAELAQWNMTALAWSPDGKLVATGAENGCVRLRDPGTGGQVGRVMNHSTPVTGLAFSPDGRTLASASEDSRARLWDVADQEKIREFPHEDPFGGETIRNITFSSDGHRMFTSAWTFADVCAWEVATGELHWRMASGSTSEGTPSPLLGSHGERIFLFSEREEGSRILDARTGATLVDLRSRRLTYLRPSPDERQVVAIRGGAVVVLDGATMAERYAVTILAHGVQVRLPNVVHSDASPAEVRSTFILLDGKPCPLESFAAVLWDPKRSAAALAGVPVAPPALDPPPELAVRSPLARFVEVRSDRVTVEAQANDSRGLAGFEIERDGAALDPDLVRRSTRLSPDGKTGSLSLELARGTTAELDLRVFSVSRRGLVSRPALRTVRFVP